MDMTRRQVLLGGAGLAAATAIGARARPAGAQAAPKRDLIVALGGDITKFDPHFGGASSVNEIRVAFNLFDTLLNRHPDGKLYPSLATEWRRTKPTTYVFKIRQGVKWHNGDPFSSADVKFSIERTYDPAQKTMVATIFTTIEQITAPDPATIIITTKKPDPLLPARLAFIGGHIVPKKYIEAVGNDTFNTKPIGTGPVRFVSWVKDDRCVLEANPDYWDGRIDADRVIFRAIPETAPRIASLLAGEVNAITQLPPDHVEAVKNHPATQVRNALFSGLYVLCVNSKRPPLDKPLVKQALSLAIDRASIVKELWRAHAIVATGPIAKGDNHFDPTLPPLPYDPREAQARLKRSGYNGEEIVIETTTGYMSNDKAMAEVIQSMWKDIGVNAKVEVIEYSVRAQKNREKSFKGMWWADPTSTLSDPDGMMWRLLGPGGVQDYWRHPRWDALGEAARFSVDETARGDAYREMTQIFFEYLPWIPVLQPYEDYGFQRYVDLTPNANQQLDVRRFNFRMRRA